MFKVGQKVLVLGKHKPLTHYLMPMSKGVIVEILFYDRCEVKGIHGDDSREVFQTVSEKDLLPCEFKDYVTKLNKQI